jgi:hypothetical protein
VRLCHDPVRVRLQDAACPCSAPSGDGANTVLATRGFVLVFLLRDISKLAEAMAKISTLPCALLCDSGNATQSCILKNA